MILSNNNETYDESAPFRAVDTILKAVEEGRITEERINESYERIGRLKEKHAVGRGRGAGTLNSGAARGGGTPIEAE